MKNNSLVYHGNYMIVEFPEIRKHKFTKDFSWGFYCTSYKEQAKERSMKFKTSIVNIYKIKKLDYLNIKEFKEYDSEWLDFVIKCRSGETHKYDIVSGPVADDTIYEYLEAYQKGQMKEEEFFKLMKFKYPTHQISFHTIQALDVIEYIESYEI